MTSARSERGIGPVDVGAAMDRFTDRVRHRLAAGAVTYGDRSFTRPADELVDEIRQELEDVCGWGLLLWIRLDRPDAFNAIDTGGAHEHA